MKNKLYLLIGLVGILIALFLRIYSLSSVPPAPYWEEVALGYDAYSLLKTGRDHHGNWLPIVALESFGDWKPAVYAYAIIPFIAFFDLSVLAVRLPAVASGVFAVLGTAVLTYLVIADDKVKNYFNSHRPALVALTALFISAISPWLLLFSRAGWEVMLATSFILWGMIAGFLAIKPVNQKSYTFHTKYAMSAVILLVVSMYTYHSARLTAPLLGIGLFVYWMVQSQQSVVLFFQVNYKKFIFLTCILLALLSPFLFVNKQLLSQRFQETSSFGSLEIVSKSNLYKELSGSHWWSAVLFHRYVFYSEDIVSRFMSHFSFNFLFVSGDQNLRHSTQFVGQLYLFESLFLILGLFATFKFFSTKKALLLWWLLVGIFPASLTNATPHALRILPAVPVFLVLIAQGIDYSFATITGFFTGKIWQKRALYFSGMSLFLVYVLFFTQFWIYYQKVYPVVSASEWQFGYQEVIANVTKLHESSPEVPLYITREKGRPAMYYWFYTKTNPQIVQSANASNKKDQAEFLEFGSVFFPNTTSEVIANQAFIISSEQGMKELEKRGYEMSEVQLVSNPKNEIVFAVYRAVAY